MTRTKGPRASEDERKERRRAANRRSARKSRYKENVLLDELQKTVAELAKQNQSLKAENDAFKQDVVALQSLVVCKNNLQLQSLEPSKPTPLLYQSFKDSLQNPLLDHQQQQQQLGNSVTRTPSPVESFNLNLLDPDRIFPVGENQPQQQPTNAVTMMESANLFRAAYQFSAEAV